MKLALGLHLVAVFGRHQDELKAAGYNLLDTKSSEKLGNDVGVQLVFECPDFMNTLVKNSRVVTDIAQRNKQSPSGTISGTLVNISGGDFSYLQVADDKGKIEKLWWMEYFDGPICWWAIHRIASTSRSACATLKRKYSTRRSRTT